MEATLEPFGHFQPPGRGCPGWQEALEHVFNLPLPACFLCTTIKAFFTLECTTSKAPTSRHYQIGTEAFTGGPATFTCIKFTASLLRDLVSTMWDVEGYLGVQAKSLSDRVVAQVV